MLIQFFDRELSQLEFRTQLNMNLKRRFLKIYSQIENEERFCSRLKITCSPYG